MKFDGRYVSETVYKTQSGIWMSYIIASTRSQQKEYIGKNWVLIRSSSQSASDVDPTNKWDISNLEDKIQDEDNKNFWGEIGIVKTKTTRTSLKLKA